MENKASHKPSSILLTAELRMSMTSRLKFSNRPKVSFCRTKKWSCLVVAFIQILVSSSGLVQKGESKGLFSLCLPANKKIANSLQKVQENVYYGKLFMDCIKIVYHLIPCAHELVEVPWYLPRDITKEQRACSDNQAPWTLVPNYLDSTPGDTQQEGPSEMLPNLSSCREQAKCKRED